MHYVNLFWVFPLLAATLLLCVLSACAPAAEVTPSPAPTPASTPEAAAEPLTVTWGGIPIPWRAGGWDEDLAAGAVTVPWDAGLSVSFGPAESGASNIKVQRTVLNHLGQAFFSDHREAGAELTERGLSIRHEPFGGLWDLPAAEPYRPEVTVGYCVSLSSGTETENFYFAVKSEFPTLASASLRERVQSSADCGETLRVLETAGDTDGDGQSETVCVGVTKDRIPFLSVDGNIVLTMDRNDESYYDGATLCALDLDGDGRDEVMVLLGGPGLGSALRLQAAEYEDGCWRELPVPRLETAVLDTTGYSADGEGIFFESVLELSGGPDGGAPVYLRVPVTLRLRDGTFQFVLGEVRESTD